LNALHPVHIERKNIVEEAQWESQATQA
jgi:hypothetical protein